MPPFILKEHGMSPNGSSPARSAGFFSKLWNAAVSPTVFVILACLWCLDLGAGSLYAFRRDPEFWMKMDSMPFNLWLANVAPGEMPHSLWVYALVILTWLVAASLVLCTVGWFLYRRARKRSVGEILVHLGFMLVFAGFVIGGGWGQRAQNIIALAGEAVEAPGMGVKLKLGDIRIVRNERGEQLETVSNLTLLDKSGAELASGSARLNHPLIHGETVVYPNGGSDRLIGAHLEAEGIGAVEVRYGKDTPLPGGGALRIKGMLEEGQRYSRWVGPGAFIVLVGPTGVEESGAFFGDFPLFRMGRLGGAQLEWKRPIISAVASFNVHRDPGVQLVLAGALILTLGTFWALAAYLKREG